MKKSVPFVVLALAAALWSFGALARSGETSDKTLAPYFLVKGADDGVDRLPLKSTSARVNIAGVIADVTVTQVYRNEGTRALEAVYIFPGSTRAAVYGLKMKIGERTIEARIKERRQARRVYEQAKKAGKTASLLEQHRPNVFRMSVANILPGDTVGVELRYTELLVPTDGVYEFDYPTVVGPRYSNRPTSGAPPGEAWVQNPYLHQGEKPTYTFGMAVTISAGMPLRDVACPSHKTTVTYDGPDTAKVALDTGESDGGNRDFILRYRLAGGKIRTGLLLYKGEKENFFLMMMQPPRRVAPSDIPPREYIFVVDVSGSMYGFPLETAKSLLHDLIGGLRQTDRFDVLLFSGGSALFAPQSVPATAENVQRALDFLDAQNGGGGTEILPALKRALALPRPDGFSRSIVITTDGYVAVERQTFDLIRENLDQANFFPFGIGTSVNRYLIEGMARVGMGEPFVVTNGSEAQAQAQKFRAYIQSPVLSQVKVDFLGFDAYDVEPETVPDVLAERPVIVFGKWKGEATGTIRLEGIAGEGTYERTLDVAAAKPASENAALRYLWARKRIALLGDYKRLEGDGAVRAEITRLGLNYNLLTAYTSFVAVDTTPRRVDPDLTTVKQALPLPKGVSDLAVGGTQISTTPEPSTWVLLIVAGVLFAVVTLRRLLG
jgi:Ca-activated chloride channel family protein